jgi:RHS repeat-associated protein
MNKTTKAALALVLALVSGVSQAETQTRTVSYEYNAQGRLTKELVEPDVANDCMQAVYGHDGLGNRTTTSVAACVGASGYAMSSAATTRTTTTSFDANGRFPVSATNPLGHAETQVLEPKLGTVTSLTGPNNLTTTWQYDAFGRKARETRADGTYTSWTYKLCTESGANCPASVGPGVPVWMLIEQSYAVNNAINSPEKRQFHDRLNRAIRVQTQGFNAQAVVEDAEYNSQGLVARRSTPYFVASASPVWTSFSYDSLGRVTQKSRPDPVASGGVAVTTYGYNGSITTTTNAKTQVKTVTTGARGKINQVIDAKGSVISYGWDAFDQLTQVNAAGSITTLGYNKRGQKVSMLDPAMGSWVYAYNAFGELVWQRDSLNQVSTVTYDTLGRMTQRSEPDLVSNWNYDKKFDATSCGKGIGKLCEATANNGYRRIHTYDALGRPSVTATVLDNPSAPATVTEAFDANTGRLISKTWPTGYQASYTYNSFGYLQAVTGGGTNGFIETVSYTVQSMNALGQVTQWLSGNQVITANNYDATTHRLAGIQATRTGQATGNVLNHAYTWDAVGNLASRIDNTPGVATQESFSYDVVNRLTLATIVAPGVSPSMTEVMYDDRDNITYKSDVGRYWYDAARTNRMTQVTLETAPGAQVTLAGTRALSYAFDDTKPGAQNVNGTTVGNGNLEYTVSHDTVNSLHTVRSETYTSFNMPQQFVWGNFITSTTSTADRTLTFVYSPEHQRIKQTVALSGNGTSAYKAGSTWYLNGVDSLGLSYEKEVTDSGMTEHKHYVTAGGQVFALYVTRSGSIGTQTTSTTSYLHNDHLGSAAAITDQTGAVAERLAYDPWGKRRNPTGQNDITDSITGKRTDRGYSMHEHLDEVGIIHMNGRLYDPLIGRFMSPDDIIPNPTDLKAFNRYSYVSNNPLRLVDPTGHLEEQPTSPDGGGPIEGAGDWGPGPPEYSDQISTELSYPEWVKERENGGSTNQSSENPPGTGRGNDTGLLGEGGTGRGAVTGIADGNGNVVKTIETIGKADPNTIYCTGGCYWAQEQSYLVAMGPFVRGGAIVQAALQMLWARLLMAAGSPVGQAVTQVAAAQTGLSMVGRNYGTLGTVVSTLPVNVKGIATSHFIQQMETRGVTATQVVDAIQRPVAILQQAGGTHLMIGQEAAVAVNAGGGLVTTYSRSHYDANVLQVLRDVAISQIPI